MATMATTVTEAVAEQPTLSTAASYGDWRDDFFANGYAVVKGAIPPARAAEYRQRIFAWLKSFNTALDLDDPSTWVAANLPVQTKINTFHAYAVAHEAFMWDARLEPGVVDAFAKLWGTDELLVSFDALNVTFPNRTDRPAKGAWPHLDQSPFRRGLQCAQGVINLSPAGPADGSLLAFPRSQALVDEFFDTQTDRGAWERKDSWLFTDTELQWFLDRGITPLRVPADPGDLIIWDSRMIHYGAEPTAASDVIRTVIYASYAPARWASAETLEMKKKVFEKWQGTTHWAHDNVVLRESKPLLEDGSVDPRNREEPREMPVLSERLLRLAGVRAY